MPEQLTPMIEYHVGAPMRQFRFLPIRTGQGAAFLAIHADCAGVDPYHRMFFLPTDTLKLTAFSAGGERLWQRDLGPGMIPGTWFCPIFALDLDGDGVDEIYLVNNSDAEHALDFESFVLERLSAADGAVLESRPWPMIELGQDMSCSYRNFINAAEAGGRKRLITAQGTYGPMQLQCYDSDMELLWQRKITPADPGARGSHMFPVVDLDGDGRDELLWGERCIDVDTGRDIWVGDLDGWRGHSDVIQPTRDADSGRWVVYTCREAHPPNGAVVMFDDGGRELWGRRGLGHMDMGWTARLGEGGGHLCYALQIGVKTAGPEGFKRSGMTELFFDLAGREVQLPFSAYQTLPVDFNGDGLHELMYVDGPRVGRVIDRTGAELARLEGTPAYGGKIADAPGEQIVTWSSDGTVRVYACPDAADSPAAEARYRHPYYAACLRGWASGYNRTNLGGL